MLQCPRSERLWNFKTREIWSRVVTIILQNFGLKNPRSSYCRLRGIHDAEGALGYCHYSFADWKCSEHKIVKYAHLRIPTNPSHYRMPHILPLEALVSISSSQSTPETPEPPIDEAVPVPLFRLPVTLFVVRTILSISNGCFGCYRML